MEGNIIKLGRWVVSMINKEVFFDIRQLKRIREDVENIGSDDLKRELDDALMDNDGKYLYNILSEECLTELDYIKDLLLVSL